MTNFFSPQGAQSEHLEGNGAGQPGGAPVGSSMQGNPQESSYQPFGVQPPVPLTPVQQLLPTQVSNGQIPANAQPSNTVATANNDSLLAQIARGQVMLGDSTYGQSGFIPANGGASPQAAQPAQNATQSVTTRVASAVAFSGNNYTGS